MSFHDLWEKSAAQYREYASRHPQYAETNEYLVTLANLRPGQEIVDLACGTGLTSAAILKEQPAIGRIFAVDFSQEMLAMAKELVPSGKVSFLCADAQDIATAVQRPVDTALCNSAFWQFNDYAKVLHSVRKILKDGGTFVFNIPQQFAQTSHEESLSRILLQEIFSELRSRGYDPQGKLKGQLSFAQIEELARREGFVVERIEERAFTSHSIEERLSFFRIPAVAPFFSGVPQKAQEEILEKVREKMGRAPREIPPNIWVYVVLAAR